MDLDQKAGLETWFQHLLSKYLKESNFISFRLSFCAEQNKYSSHEATIFIF